MIKTLHYLNDPRLWELWYILYYGYCRMYIINRMYHVELSLSHSLSLYLSPHICVYM